MLLGTSLPDSAFDAHITALTASYRIPANIARQLPLRGSPAAVAERLCSYADAGAQHIVLGLIGDDWRQQCDLLAEAVRLACPTPSQRTDSEPAAARPSRGGPGKGQ